MPGRVVHCGGSMSSEAEGGRKLTGIGLVQVVKERGALGAEGGI